MKDLFTGTLVRLAAINPDEASQFVTRWGRDSEYRRLMDSDPPRLFSVRASREWMKKQLEEEPETYWFAIRTLEDDRLLGNIDLAVTSWGNRDAFVGIGIGEREFWGKGYGTDAMVQTLRYAFTELNLQRVTLNVFEFNERAVRSYEKIGFRMEGRQRQAIIREGRRWDILYMGILKEEWIKIHGNRIYDE